MLLDCFHPGEIVYYKEEPGRPDTITPQFGFGPFKVVKTEPVPADKQVDAGPHVQWGHIESYDYPISAVWFSRDKPRLFI